MCIENYKAVKTIDEFLDQSNEVEAQIKEIEMIGYPPEWKEFSKYHSNRIIPFIALKTSIQRVDNKSAEYKQIKDIVSLALIYSFSFIRENENTIKSKKSKES